MTKRFDIRTIRKLEPRARYGELYFYWREAELMIASSLPSARRYGHRLKKRVEDLYSEWFKPQHSGGFPNTQIPEHYSSMRALA